MRVWIEEKKIDRGIRRIARIEREGSQGSGVLWFDIESNHPVPTVKTADSFACALLMHCMRLGERLHIEAPVSRRLLQNLDEYQAAWRAFMPRVWKGVDVSAQSEVDFPADPALVNKAVIALSGGMDGAFSYFRHRDNVLARPFDITAAFLVHGFDSRLAHVGDFEFMRRSVTGMIGQDDIALYTIRTNLRDDALAPNWSFAHGAGLAACAHFFAESHGVGLVGGDFKYSDFPDVWGSSPITNHLLSSASLRMTYDGAGFSRCQKAQYLNNHPAAMENLSVCHKGAGGQPCCACEKCIRTVLNFRATGSDVPKTFQRPIDPSAVAALTLATVPSMIFARDIYLTAKRNGITDTWVRALGAAIRKARETAAT